MDDFSTRFRAAAREASDSVVWARPDTPAEVFRYLADACDEGGLEEWDGYAERGPVATLEAEVAALLGTDAAAYFPSGVMAQQCALRVWSDRAGTRRVALPELSHLLRHELDGPRLVHGFEVEHLTTGRTVATADHLAALPGRLAAVLVELPLRDAGCLLPTWEELTALSAAARVRGVPLHVDGARLWESQSFYDRPLDEIAGLADSVYVSFYKGLGGLAGACLAGPEDFVEEARRWRKRMGGTLFRATPEAVAALVGLRTRLPRIAESVAWARRLAEELAAEGLVVHPAPPHTNTFEVYAAGSAEDINEHLLAFVTAERLVPCAPWRPTDEPGRAMSEIAVGVQALHLDPAQVASRIAGLVAG